METRLLHIFRNTPLGRETLLQSIYFCKLMNIMMTVYIPNHVKFLMYFDNDVVQVDLDNSYLTSPDTSLKHATDILEPSGITYKFFEPKYFTASTLPDIPTNHDFMCCPRSISDPSSKIGLGHIGPRVRRIVKSARFPVLLTSAVYKEWKNITVFFGGSNNALKALKLGFRICRETGLPLDIFTQAGKNEKEEYIDIIEKAGLKDELEMSLQDWLFFETGKLEENLFEVKHDSLVIIGAYGHSVIKDYLFGSKMETINSTVTNNILIVGPNYTSKY